MRSMRTVIGPRLARVSAIVMMLAVLALLAVPGCRDQVAVKGKPVSADMGGGGGNGFSGEQFRAYFSSLRENIDPCYPENPIYLRVPANASGEPQYALPLLLPDSVEKDIFPNVERENPDELTIYERLFAFGWVHKNAEEWWGLTHDEQYKWLMERENVERRGFWVSKVDPVLEIARRWTLHFLKTGEKLTDTAVLLENFRWGETLAESGAVMKQELLDYVTSPITGKLVEIGCPEFSRGNMVIDAFPMSRFSAEDLGIIYDLHVGQDAGSVEDIVLVAYRVYGETGVIRTGVLVCSLKDQNILSVS